MSCPTYRLNRKTGEIFYKLGHVEELIITVHCPVKAREVLKWLKNGSPTSSNGSNLTTMEALINLNCN
jgi:hypothetical protein